MLVMRGTTTLLGSRCAFIEPQARKYDMMLTAMLRGIRVMAVISSINKKFGFPMDRILADRYDTRATGINIAKESRIAEKRFFDT